MQYRPAQGRLQRPQRASSVVYWGTLIGLFTLLLTFTLTPEVAYAKTAATPTHVPKQLTPAQVAAIEQQLKKQIHVTHHGTATANTSGVRQFFGPAYNNIGISDQNTRATANFDGVYRSYSAQALQDAGLYPGLSVTSQNITFIWPNVPTGQADNYQAAGQVIAVTSSPGAATIGFLGAADSGATSGTATLTYTDNSTSTFTLGFTDWWSGSAQFGNQQVAHMTTINTKHGTKSGNFYLYSATTTLNTSKTLQSVTLPSSVSPGRLHVFAVAVGGPAFNNTGISNDSNPGSANYDGGGANLSAQALAGANLVPGKQIDNDGIAYTWPSAASGAPDNYQANGQVLPVVPVPNATVLGLLGSAAGGGNSTGTATITYTDNSTQTFTLGMSDWTNGSPLYGNRIAASMTYYNRSSGRQNLNIYLFTAEVTLTVGKTIQSVTLPGSTTPGQIHIFAIGTRSTFNNLASSNDSQPGGGNMDNGYDSYSVQALEATGITPGKPFSYDGTSFTISASYGLLADNYLVSGQVLPVTPVANATTLAFLGSAAYGPSHGTATITYTDNSTSTFTLDFSDWTLNAGTQSVEAGNSVAANMSYRNTPTGSQTVSTYLFYTETPLNTGKTIQSVTLPSTVNQGQLHVFAIGTRSQYNNTGISDNSNTTGANLDGLGNSYSAQDFADPTIAGWNPGDTLTYEGINYVWPGVPAGQADNYQAAGQAIPVSPVANATTIGFVGSADNAFPSSSGTATLTYTDNSTQTFTLGFSDWHLDGGTGTPLASNRLFALLPHYNNPQGTQTSPVYLFETEILLTAGKTLQSVTLPSSVNQGHLHVFMIGTRSGENYPNNIGTSDDSNTIFANYDGSGNGNSYSIEALEANNIYEGQTFAFNGVNFSWPASYSVIPDNYQANGQVIPVTPVANANTLAFLGSATYGPSHGTATITYTDNSTSTFTLDFSDWTLNAGTQSIEAGNSVAAHMSYRNTPTGSQTVSTYLFYTETPLNTSKTIQSVTLPSTVNQGQLHVFAIGTRAGLYYNNAGISDDSSPLAGNFDGGTTLRSWSAQTLQQDGIAPGATLIYQGVNFVWPNVPSGQFDNYQANGQIIAVSPVANATTLAFLGASTNGPSQGTATITYTDNSTQNFSLGFTDWAFSTTSYGNITIATVPYVNSPSGKVNGNHYLFYASVALQSGKTVQSVTLPSTVNQGALHVFAVGTM